MDDTIPEGHATFWPPECNRLRFYYSEANQTFNCDAFDWDTRELIEKIATLDYIHQLQNLYFTLTREELILDRSKRVGDENKSKQV